LRPEAAALEALLAPAPGRRFGGEPVLATLRVRPGFEAAIGAAFADGLAAPLAESAPGTASPPEFWAALPPLDACPSLPEGARPLAETVDAPAALGRRLALAGWVETAEAGHRLQSALAPGQRLVDRDGRWWRWDGFTRIGAGPSAAAEHLRQKKRLALLATEIAEAETEHRMRGSAHAAARAAHLRAAAAEDAARAELRAAAAALEAARAAQSALAQQALAAETRLAALAEALDRVAAEIAETAAEAGEVERELQAFPLPEPARAALEAARIEAEAARRQEAEARVAVERLSRQTEARRERLSAIEAEAQGWRRRTGGAAAQHAALVERRRILEEEIAALSRRLSEIAEQSEAAGPAMASAAAERRRAAEMLARGEAELRTANEEARSTAEASAELKLRSARLEALQDGAREAVSRLAREIGERLGAAPEALAALAGLAEGDPPADPEDAAARLERLRRERDGIGPVNLLAESEAAEVGERVEELRRERAELTEAIARLRRGMARLDHDARARLTAAFERVNRHFADLFARLFAGGRARLALTDDADPLAAGLEIMASPGGKRLQALSLLSGGEQALTALALLFAVFLTTPAPVCVLDEVDAPLDDANVERLCTLVADIAEETGTRFLLVTHHRITMARADRLFGVTMAEPGVSQLVSVDLARAVRFRKSA
jgi:chromosome segregation protein